MSHPTILTVLGSEALGLQVGTWTDLDRVVAAFSREAIVLRTITMLHALAGGADAHRRTNAAYLNIAPADAARRIRSIQQGRETASFLEEWQQIVILKRALVVSPEVGRVAFSTPEGESAFFDACRFAADVLGPEADPFDREAKNDPHAWVKIAAHLMPRIWLSNPPGFQTSIGRFELMLGTDSPHVLALKGRFPEAFDLTFEDTQTLTRFLTAWLNRHRVDELLADPESIRLNPATWLGPTLIPYERLRRFLDRTSRRIAVPLEEAGAGAKASPLPFRDRPLLEFSDGSVAAAFPPLLMEKLTGDVFWWLKDLHTDQARTWQRDWGYVAEDYVIATLRGIAERSGCEFCDRLETRSGEMDALLWRPGIAAVFEVTTSSLREAEGSSTDWEKLREGLLRAFVADPTGKGEAVMQLARDVSLVASSELPCGQVDRIFPVMITADRRTRTPGIVRFLQSELAARLTVDVAARVAPLALWHLDDLEAIDGLLAQRLEWRTGDVRGPFTLLKLWDWERGRSPAWWMFLRNFYEHVPQSPAIVTQYENWRASVADRFPQRPADDKTMPIHEEP